VRCEEEQEEQRECSDNGECLRQSMAPLDSSVTWVGE
jgi:hypothetical protein